ncbi:hypothetical protein SAMN05192588_1402 [Nonlabens sp. Hel1_33_55]|uniref:hypothetical protein n=1 Tax=Nonlabens sp. Hel1_33_55 TaxID=1336802 RepID=UPI000875DF63|nr:hypothetical protein [Nonlabens sp. Hel1_33_55]SCY15244.1 hypothetical protein SAMN05192588_1402 [Nonlabens sp. Hel1_33_55]
MRYLYLLSFLFLAFSFSACDPLTDCIIPTRPELPNSIFNTAVAGQYYEHSFRAQVDNEPRDDSYFYYFTVNGLPRGMDYEWEGRRLFIFGSPLDRGDFRINVFLTVEPVFFTDDDGGILEDGDTLCEDSTSRDYTLSVR